MDYEAAWRTQVGQAGGAVHARYDTFGHLLLYAVFPNQDGLPSGEYAYTLAPASVLLQVNGDVTADQSADFLNRVEQSWNDYKDSVAAFFADDIPSALAHVASWAGKTAGKVAGDAALGLWPVLLIGGALLWVVMQAANTPAGRNAMAELRR